MPITDQDLRDFLGSVQDQTKRLQMLRLAKALTEFERDFLRPEDISNYLQDGLNASGSQGQGQAVQGTERLRDENMRLLQAENSRLQSAAAGAGTGAAPDTGRLAALEQTMQDLREAATESQKTMQDLREAATESQKTMQDLREAARESQKTTQDVREAATESQKTILDLQGRTDQLSLKLHHSSMTSKTDAQIGEECRTNATSVTPNDLGLIEIFENDLRVQFACKEVWAAFPTVVPKGISFVKSLPGKKFSTEQLIGMTLADAANWQPKSGFQEEKHMQPVVMKVMEAVAKAVKCEVKYKDTHNTPIHDSRTSSISKPDILGLASASTHPVWAEVVTVCELKLDTSKPEVDTMVGQLLQRCVSALKYQPGRKAIHGIGLSMQNIMVLRFTLNANGRLTAKMAEAPFSVDITSAGFQLLVRVLATPIAQLGFTRLPTPNLFELGDFKLSSLAVLTPGNVGVRIRHIYRAEVEGGVAAVIKLSSSTVEGDLLAKLKGVPNIIRMVAQGTCVYQDVTWRAILLQPFLQHLKYDDQLTLVAKVANDVAGAIHVAAENFGVYQRDVTPNNIGYFDGDGYLMDFASGVFYEPGSDLPPPTSPRSLPGNITATMLYAPLSILNGKPHTVSSQLEGLFHSILGISCNGRVLGFDEHYRTDLDSWVCRRYAQFASPKLYDAPQVCARFANFVGALHDLFWAKQDGQLQRAYRQNVTAAEFQCVCQMYLS